MMKCPLSGLPVQGVPCLVGLAERCSLARLQKQGLLCFLWPAERCLFPGLQVQGLLCLLGLLERRLRSLQDFVVNLPVLVTLLYMYAQALMGHYVATVMTEPLCMAAGAVPRCCRPLPNGTNGQDQERL